MKFSDRLKELRTIRGITQKELADSVGISAGAVYSYESKRQVPNIQTIFDICNTYEVSADWLLGLTEVPAKMSLGQIVRTIKTMQENTTVLIMPLKPSTLLGQALVLILPNKDIHKYFATEMQTEKFLNENVLDRSVFDAWKSTAMRELEETYDDKRRELSQTSSEIIGALEHML